MLELHQSLGGIESLLGTTKRFEEVECRVWHERVYGLMNACIDLGFLNKAAGKQAEAPSSVRIGRGSRHHGVGCKFGGPIGSHRNPCLSCGNPQETNIVISLVVMILVDF